MNLSSFRLVVLPGSNPAPDLKAHYDRAYAHWDDVWRKTFVEVENRRTLFSDDFTRQSEILAIFHDLRCVAIVCHRSADLSSPVTRNDSYFQAWPADALEKLGRHGPKILVGSQISVDPDYRGQFDGVSLKNIVSALTIQRLTQIDVDAMPGTMRVDKNTHTLVYECGAVPILKNIMYHNRPTDLLAIFPKVNPITIPEELGHVVARFWAERRGEAPLDRVLGPQPRREAGHGS